MDNQTEHRIVNARPRRKPLVIVPTYNEVGNVENLFRQVSQQMPAVHMLFVDDNSQDGTRDVIAQLQREAPERVHMLPRAGKLGLGTAYIAGFKWALQRDYDAVVEMDADLSHRPVDLPRLVAKLADVDAAVGSRYTTGGGTENWNFGRKLISRFGSLYARTILGIPVNDLTGGFNAWSREILETVPLDDVKSEGYSFQIELKFRAHLAGFKLAEVPIVFVERRVGQSKMSSRIVVEAMFRVWALLGLRFQPVKKRVPAA